MKAPTSAFTFGGLVGIVSYSVINVKALVSALNQEKALVGAFSVIAKTGSGTDGSVYCTMLYPVWRGQDWDSAHGGHRPQ